MGVTDPLPGVGVGQNLAYNLTKECSCMVDKKPMKLGSVVLKLLKYKHTTHFEFYIIL